MKLLITGREGQFARALLEAAARVGLQAVAIGRPGIDVTDERSVREAIARERPDILINTAAYTAVDKAESEPILAHAVNAVGAGFVAKACAAHAIPIIQISTDHVFDGAKHSPYVITTDFTFSATAMSIIHVGATPVLADIDPLTLNIDCGKIEDLITSRTKAIMPVHYAGLSCDMDMINAVARRHGLKVIEDAAHALPTTWGGCMIGNATSDASVFSFYATKTITTGEGGMITCRDADVARRARILRLHGIDRDVFMRYQGGGNSWGYEIVAPGFKSNLTDIAAAIGIVQLKRAWDFHKRRSELSNTYDRELGNLPVLLPPKAPQGDLHSFHLYAIRLRTEAPIGRNAFIERMADLGINCSVHFIPLHLHSYWREKLNVSEAMFPQSQKAFEQLVTLPMFPSMTDEMQSYVISAAKRILS